MTRLRLLVLLAAVGGAAVLLLRPGRQDSIEQPQLKEIVASPTIGSRESPEVSPARIQPVKRDAAALLQRPSALSMQEFLVALQELERSEPIRALKLLSERVEQAPRDENRIYLLGFPARFTGRDAPRKFSKWALRQKDLKLEPEELQILSEMYFSRPAATEGVLQDWVPILDVHEAENRRYLMFRLMEHVSEQPVREKLGRNLSKRYGIRAEELLALPPLADSKIEENP